MKLQLMKQFDKHNSMYSFSARPHHTTRDTHICYRRAQEAVYSDYVFSDCVVKVKAYIHYLRSQVS